MIGVSDKSATLSRTCLGLCRKVGVMEFGLDSHSRESVLVLLIHVRH